MKEFIARKDSNIKTRVGGVEDLVSRRTLSIHGKPLPRRMRILRRGNMAP